MTPTQAGRYIAVPTEWTVGQSKNNFPQFVCRFHLLHWWNGGEWEDVAHRQWEITEYFNLVYVNRETGQPTKNEINIEQIKAALGWDGGSFGTLANADWSRAEVQLSLEEETYNGKTRIRLKYLNPRDYQGGGLAKAEPQEIQSLDAKYGALLRAGQPPKPAAAPPAKSLTPAQQAQMAAWAAFQDVVSKYQTVHPDAEMMTTDTMKAEFRKVAESMYPGRDVKNLIADEWEKVKAKVQKDYSPLIRDLLPI